MSIAVTYWEVIKTPDGSDQAWHGEVVFNIVDAPEWIKPYLEPRVMHVPEPTFHNKDFNPRAYHEALYPEHYRKRRVSSGS